MVSAHSCPWPAWQPPVALPLAEAPPHPCAYLPGRAATMRAVWADRVDDEAYGALMDAGFRRNGCVIYQPVCRGCRQCLPIRVRVEDFAPSKSQRRCMRRNADLAVGVSMPKATDEKYLMYRSYLAARHTVREDDDRASFEAFLYRSPVTTIECSYRDPAGRLVAVGICDLCPRALSSVYFYFDPAEARRGLGTFGALHEIELARELGIEFYYMGYWVKDCAAMRYKSSFRPCEVLGAEGEWRIVKRDA